MPISFVDVQGLLVHGQPRPDSFASLGGSAWKGRVYVTEGRPLLSGARETVPELLARGHSPTLISDNMVAYCMWKGLVQAAIVSYWRKAEGGLVCPVGSLAVAVCASYHRIPVLAIPARQESEPLMTHQDLLELLGHPITADGVDAFTPSTDLVAEHWIAEIREGFEVTRLSDQGGR